MENLWAPWRMEFIVGEKEPGCVFCVLPQKQEDRKNLILYRGQKAYVILNKFPYNNGHLMVVPYLHTQKLEELDSETLVEMMRLVEKSVSFLNESMRAEGHNIGINLGRAAGAGILDHLHIHVVPRWFGDVNFMPVLSQNKVMIEYLWQSYDRLYPLFSGSHSS